jgi:hypothetical protein
LRANDVRITAEFSSDLISWQPGALLANTNLGTGLSMVVIGFPSSERSMLFARIKAERIR